MNKESLHAGKDYGFRENTRAWERAEDRPVRVTLLDRTGSGRYHVVFPDGSEREVRSRQLVLAWDEAGVAALLRADERERGFRKATHNRRAESDAVTLVLETVVPKANVWTDRLWLSPDEGQKLRDAADVADDLLDLSPVAYRDDDGDICLPLPVAEMLAKRIAERNPDSVVAAVERDFEDLVNRGYLGVAESHKPGWDLALDWASKPPKEIPPEEINPHEAMDELFDRLRGQGMHRTEFEERAWFVEPHQLRSLGHLLGPVASYAGRIKIEDLGKGQVRLAVEPAKEREVLNSDQIIDLAYSLSQSQARMLREIRSTGKEGAEYPAQLVEQRTLDSLARRGLIWESRLPGTDLESRAGHGRFRLTDAGWRVLDRLGPRPS